VLAKFITYHGNEKEREDEMHDQNTCLIFKPIAFSSFAAEKNERSI
jgi:hypothetical protein